MNGRQPGDIIVSLLAGAGGGFIALFYLNYSLVDADWCGGAQASCFRDWVSATGGWAATLAAGITAWFIYGQFSEARRQSSVIARENLPIVSLFDPRETSPASAFANRLQIVNINARPVLIKAIRLCNEDAKFTWWEVVVLDHDYARGNALQRELTAGRLYIPGIAEREDQRPTVVEFDISVTVDPVILGLPQGHEVLQRVEMTLEVEMVVVGEAHHVQTVVVSRPDALVFVDWEAHAATSPAS